MEPGPAVLRPQRLNTDNPATMLDPISIDDIADLYSAIERNRARLAEWLPWATPEYGLEHARRFITDRVVENDRRTALTCVIRYKDHLAGAIGLHTIDELNRSSSIGYWIDQRFAGLGIVTCACRALVTYGFTEFALHRIEIRCATSNYRSCAIPRRLGFTDEGILRGAGRVGDRWLDLRVFSILEHEWR